MLWITIFVTVDFPSGITILSSWTCVLQWHARHHALNLSYCNRPELTLHLHSPTHLFEFLQMYAEPSIKSSSLFSSCSSCKTYSLERQTWDVPAETEIWQCTFAGKDLKVKASHHYRLRKALSASECQVWVQGIWASSSHMVHDI